MRTPVSELMYGTPQGSLLEGRTNGSSTPTQSTVSSQSNGGCLPVRVCVWGDGVASIKQWYYMVYPELCVAGPCRK